MASRPQSQSPLGQPLGFQAIKNKSLFVDLTNFVDQIVSYFLLFHRKQDDKTIIIMGGFKLN
jgi:hypothetical protein